MSKVFNTVTFFTFSGGKIICNSQGIAHVNGRLAMTRSFGDLELKSFGVTATPFIKSIEVRVLVACQILSLPEYFENQWVDIWNFGDSEKTLKTVKTYAFNQVIPPFFKIIFMIGTF